MWPESTQAASVRLQGFVRTVAAPPSVNGFLTSAERWKYFFLQTAFLSESPCSAVSVAATGLISLKCELGFSCVKSKTKLTTKKSLVAVLHWTGERTGLLGYS